LIGVFLLFLFVRHGFLVFLAATKGEGGREKEEREKKKNHEKRREKNVIDS
jgi:hypothetical protein